MVAFSSTLYRAKTGLFQAKRFQIHVNTAGDYGKTVAVFEFDLAELVPLLNDSSKESVRLNVTKCSDDPRACISLTLVSSRVHYDSVSHDKEKSCAEDSASELGSEMSAYTSYSCASSLASTCRRNVESPAPSQLSGFGDAKASAIRIAGHTATSDGVLIATDNEHDELVKAVQILETQLRESEAENVKLDATIEQKDREIERLTKIVAGNGVSNSDVDRNVMQVDFLIYMELREQYDALKLEHDACTKETARPTGIFKIAGAESDEELIKEEINTMTEDFIDDAFKRYSANGYDDTQETHPSRGQLSDVQLLNMTINELNLSKSKLEDQLRTYQTAIEQKDEELHRYSIALQRIKSARNDVDGVDSFIEAQVHCTLETALSDNKRLEKQILDFDGAMTTMEEEKARLSAQLRRAERATAAARDEFLTAQKALGCLESKSQSLSEELQLADQAREVAEENVIVAEATIGTLKQQLRNVSDQLHTTQYELESIREFQSVSTAALEEAAAKHQRLDLIWNGVKIENERLQARVEELEFQLSQSEVDGDEKTKELQMQVHEINREAEALRKELDLLRASTTQIEIDSHDREKHFQEKTTAHLRIILEQSQRLGSESMACEELSTRFQEQIEQTQKISEKLGTRVATLQEELDYFQEELIESKMKVAQLTQDNDELAIRNRQLEKDRALNTKK
ncbi:uncharacterized protein PHALS_02378 [Plasmopara halstedii]|uniref:C2 NT-type domain-containing protein n=1 Tax=Plasmopara halstedii TaxID=4781 RepID=A0A0P1AX25_PLAHL|nr:uncharacterized protein PHALS_02378 [Plasmopara halstedii]CEG46055.1 hypothetical protein PHALS_02378 [Plasmopara halstedii]|eukprot:XP_024582424.1 hypothetical protein PHALS_02378 [Plasmopara halstedii]